MAGYKQDLKVTLIDGHFMEYTILGRTGLKVSVAGLGCGGGSKLGLSNGGTEDAAVDLIRKAIDLGVNFIDTASSYGTEPAVGKAIADINRDDVVLSTKFHPAWAGVVVTPEEIINGLENSLKTLGVEYVDVFHLHGLYPKWYGHVLDNIVPKLLEERDKGKFKYLGVTENAPGDHRHETLIKAIEENLFDVVMVAYHMLNQNAEQLVFPQSQEKKVGTLIMFAVRRIFTNVDYYKAAIDTLVEQGKLPDSLSNNDDPLSFLISENGASSIIDACYRFVRHHSGSDVILFGTGSEDHLRSNVKSINSDPLPETDQRKLRELFSHLEGVGLEYPGGSGPKVDHREVDVELDTSGLKCPLPVLKAKKELRGMENQQVLRVVSTDPSSATDFIEYCDNSGNRLLDSKVSGNEYIYVIEKS
ncbi:MAG: General stress protein 69 [Alphaproteobacteria bacterium MarineAlpha3_Bin7]|nr:MAG: General stress protein 69 [Alphaproteobacteria bacterium MarineAlpha3_Bin7]|tara:strand:- start:452 stop:1702 length:1251 start_codon:yes stop_codon:yes gene_type:complete